MSGFARTSPKAIGGFFGLLLLISAAICSAAVIDQSYVPTQGLGAVCDSYGCNSTSSISASQSAAQTFTAGFSGQLVRVDLNLGQVSEPITFELRTSLSGPVLQEVTVTAAAGEFDWTPIVLTAPVLLQEGESYAFTVESDSPLWSNWLHLASVIGSNVVDPGPPPTIVRLVDYEGGSAWFRNPSTGSDWLPDGGRLDGGDLLFRTHMQPVYVPGAFGSLLLAFVFLTRQRRRDLNLSSRPA